MHLSFDFSFDHMPSHSIWYDTIYEATVLKRFSLKSVKQEFDFIRTVVKNTVRRHIKSVFLKNVLEKIKSSQNLQKQPHQFAAVWKGRFCKFWKDLILLSTFFKKTDFSGKTDWFELYSVDVIYTSIFSSFWKRVVTCQYRDRTFLPFIWDYSEVVILTAILQRKKLLVYEFHLLYYIWIGNPIHHHLSCGSFQPPNFVWLSWKFSKRKKMI